MTTDPLSSALEEASDAQPYVPDVGEAMRRGRRRQVTRRRMSAGVALVAVAGIATSVVLALPGSSKSTVTVEPSPATPSAPAAPRNPADPALVQRVTTLPASLLDSIPASTINGAGPTSVNGPALTEGGKPVVFWYGAEYSPFSAIERWPLLIALSRFGTWSSLSTATSSSTDTPASIASFTFYGARYSSPYLAFQSVESYTNQLNGNFYLPLQRLTPLQQALVQRYDGTNGSIPFIDFGNQATLAGSSYDYRLLQGKSPDEIVAAISDPTTDISKSVIGSANAMTAVLCRLTGNLPTSVCDVLGTHTTIRG